MPVEVFGKVFSGHSAAAKAAKRWGVRKPDAYVATVERAQKKGHKKYKKKK